MCFSYLRYLGLCAGQLAVANNLGEHVRLTQDQNLVGTDLDLGPAVLAEDDLVAFLEIHLDVLPVLVPSTGAYGEDLAALRLLLRRVGQHDAADSGLFLVEDLHDQTVTKWLQVHPRSSCSDDFVTSIGTLPSGVPGQCNGPSNSLANRQSPRLGEYGWPCRNGVMHQSCPPSQGASSFRLRRRGWLPSPRLRLRRRARGRAFRSSGTAGRTSRSATRPRATRTRTSKSRSTRT